MNNNILIIGGTASVCDGIVKFFEKNMYSIDLMTYRQKEKIDKIHEWIYLDINNYDSIQLFLKKILNKTYKKIILTPATSASNKDIMDTNREELVNFYGNFFVNYMILVKELLKNLSEDGEMVYISSIAANVPNNDVNYATGKGAMQTFIRSLSTKVDKNKSVYSISPGLIYDTPAFNHNDPKNYNNDISKLATKEGIASIIINSDFKKNGKIIKIGL